MAANSNQFLNGLGGLLGGLFGNSGKPYEDMIEQYQNFLNQGRDIQNPFYNAGTGAIGPYQDWLKQMQDPSGFINNLMGKYQESPAAKYQQQQSVRAGTNAASALGLTGSTPFAQQLQQNASNISSQDMDQWLQHVLGINTQYGAGQQNLMSGGQNSANSIMQMLSDYGRQIAGASGGSSFGGQNDLWNIIGGGLGSLGGLGLFGG